MSAAPTADRLFGAVFEGTLDALLLADDDGAYVDANEAATDLFGSSREVLPGRSIAEFYLHRPDGQIRTDEFVASIDILPGTHLSVLRDVTERDEANAESVGVPDRMGLI
ncbi:PAS domain-containing protein [Natronomonas sp. F2-12]|jgi:PAS domain-containing protein|uniref:PAS domain-containing protein n=1 Tax=Natronomonas aquatica TaxID=2841590 RepID=A0A9R1CTL5_9EURY|nr:PAS domain-containing protein [Natronomonas aquatica]MCQ4333346.1 PAS domain-containing protein [Natronomonas aquatica]